MNAVRTTWQDMGIKGSTVVTPEARRRLETRLFNSEAALVAALLPELPRLFPRHPDIAQEVESGYGIADIVLARPNQAAFRGRVVLRGSAATEPSTAQVLAALDATPRDERTVCSSLPLGRATAVRALARLEHAGYVARSDNGVRRIVDDPYGEFVAIEAKLSDWGRALCQARRYLQYANQAYIAMPVDRVRHIDDVQLRVASVGLIAVDRSGASIVIDAPLSASVQPWRRVLVGERLALSSANRTRPATPRTPAYGSLVPA